MNTLLQDYLKIQTGFSDFIREQRKERHRLLQEWSKKEGMLPTAHALVAFFKKYPNIPYCDPFSEKLFFLVYRKNFQVEKQNCFRFLCSEPFGHSFSSESFSYFCIKKEISILQLAEILCQRDPSNVDFLRLYFEVLTSSLSYTVHELSVGLMDTQEEPSFDEIISKWCHVAEKLGLDVREQAKVFRTIDDAWKQYLEIQQADGDSIRFDDYLDRKQINWKCFFSQSFWKFCPCKTE